MSNQSEAQRLFEQFQNLGPVNIYGREANPLLISVLQKDPSHVEARMEVARRYASASFPEPRIPGSLQGSATKYCNNAIAECTKIIEIDPNYLEAYKLRGLIYSDRINKHDLAISNFSKAIDLSPNDADLYISRGKSYLKKENYNELRSDFDKAFALDPKNPDVIRLLESILASKSNFLDKDSIKKIIKEYIDANKIGINDHFQKYECQKELVALNCLYARLIIICVKNGDYTQAIYDFEKEFEYYSNLFGQDSYGNSDVFQCIGIAYSELGEYRKAIVVFDKILRLTPEHRGASEGRSNALFNILEKQENDFQEKIERFLSGPTSIFKLQDHFFEREKECSSEYHGITKRISVSLSLTFITILGGIYLVYKGFDVASIGGNAFSLLPYLGIVLLIAAVPAWWTRILLRSRDRWHILREDCFRKAAIMQYIQATGRDEEFRNQIILETIKHIANRSGADLLVALHTDDSGPYSVTDLAKTYSKNKSKTPSDTN